MIFSKSYSKLAVSKAVAKIREIEDGGLLLAIFLKPNRFFDQDSPRNGLTEE